MLTAVYILCNFYNCLWLLFPQFGKLSRVMSAYKYNMLEAAKGSGKTDRYAYIYLHIYSYIYIDIYREVLGDLYDIYYDNRDLRLLLELLATSSGVAPAIAIMTLFDKVRGKTLTNHLNKFTIFCLQNFREAMKPSIRYVIASREQGLAEVQFQVNL